MIQVSRGIQLMFNPIRFAYRGYRNALRNPKYRGWVIGGTLLWLVNPINTVPILGEIDDAIVLTIFAAEVSQMALEGIKQKKAQKELNGIKDAAITS